MHFSQLGYFMKVHFYVVVKTMIWHVKVFFIEDYHDAKFTIAIDGQLVHLSCVVFILIFYFIWLVRIKEIKYKAKYKTKSLILTLILLELKLICLCQYRARPACTFIQSDQALLLASQLQLFILISLILIIDISKQCKLGKSIK